MAVTKLTDQDAIDAFNAAYSGGLCYCWHYSPNGGMGNATGEDDWLTQERLNELLEACESYEAEWDGETLELSHTPERSVHQYHKLKPGLESGLEGVRSLVCRGAHYGREWGSSCEEVSVYVLTDDQKTDLLWALIWAAVEQDEESKLGLTAVEDPTDDGNNFGVTDEAKLLAAVAACLKIEDEEEIDDEDKRAAELLETL